MQSINSRLNLFLLSLSCIRFLVFFFKYECEYNELARGFITSEYLSNSPNSMFTYSLASYFTLIINRFNCSRMRFVVDSVFTLRFCTRIFHQFAHSHEKNVCVFFPLFNLSIHFILSICELNSFRSHEIRANLMIVICLIYTWVKPTHIAEMKMKWFNIMYADYMIPSIIIRSSSPNLRAQKNTFSSISYYEEFMKKSRFHIKF